MSPPFTEFRGYSPMRLIGRFFVSAFAVVMVLGATPVMAASPTDAAASAKTDTVVIDGREYGPKDGLVVDVGRVELTRGGGDVVFDWPETGTKHGGGVTPQYTWGSSYAISSETLEIRFDGKAKAGANVFNNVRIIQVCIWYERAGAQQGDKVCSNATSNGMRWYPGPEKTTWCWDDLSSNHTIFNYSRVLINPKVY